MAGGVRSPSPSSPFFGGSLLLHGVSRFHQEGAVELVAALPEQLPRVLEQIYVNDNDDRDRAPLREKLVVKHPFEHQKRHRRTFLRFTVGFACVGGSFSRGSRMARCALES